MTTFENNFWGVSNFTAGFEILVSYMKKGRRECQDSLDFLKERAAIEEEYSRKLAKLAKSTDKKDGFGVEIADTDIDTTLRAAWKQIRDATEKEALKHKQFSEEITEKILQPLTVLRDVQKKTTQEAAEKVENAIKEFTQMRQTVPKLKKTYETKCKEHEASQMELDNLQLANRLDKQIPKVQAKLQKIAKEKEQTDQAYQQGVEKLEDSRAHWEEEMTNCCVTYENTEINRISGMKEFLTEYIDIQEKMEKGILTDAIEQGKIYIECIKPEVDIILFVSEKRTGYARPGRVFYENFYTGLMKDAMFGVDLETHLTATGRKVPETLEMCIQRIEKDGIKDEGIYRLSGRQSKVQNLKKLLDTNKSVVNLNDNDIHNNDVASLLKLYLRELPNPVGTFALYDSFLATSKIEDKNERIAALKNTVALLPEKNRCTLEFLLRHLKKVSEFQEFNRMNATNLALVFAPGLFRSENETSGLRDFKFQSKVVEDLIVFIDDFFPNPPASADS